MDTPEPPNTPERGASGPPQSQTGHRKNECARCGKEFAKAANLRRHQERKTPCKPPATPQAHRCDACGKNFTAKSSRDRHVQSGACARAQAGAGGGAKTTTIYNGNTVVHADHSVTNNVVTVNDNSVTINVTYPTRDFGEENREYLTERQLQRVLKAIPLTLDNDAAALTALRNVALLLWANSDHPENWTAMRKGPRSTPLVTRGGVYRPETVETVARQMATTIVEMFTDKTISQKSDEGVLARLRAQGKEMVRDHKLAQLVMDNAWTIQVAERQTGPKPGDRAPRLHAIKAPSEVEPPVKVEGTRMHPLIIAHHEGRLAKALEEVRAEAQAGK